MADAKAQLRDLAEGRLGPLLLKLSWPALVSMTLNSLYNVIDSVYIGHGCGDNALAGITLTFPIMMALGAFGPLIGLGHGAILSIRLGQRDRVGAEKALGECVALKLLLFFVLPPVIFAYLEPIILFVGGSGVTPEALGAAIDYMRIVVWSHVFSHLAFGLSACMRAEGSARYSMSCMIVGFGVNLVLDPIFIFGLGMGVKGAAWATVVAMMASCAWALRFYLSHKSVVRLRMRRIRLYGDMLWRTLGIGLGPFLQQVSGAAVAASMNMAFKAYLPDVTAVTLEAASAGVFHRVVMTIIMPVLGVQQGLAPIIGFNWGARSYDRVRRTVLLGVLTTSALTCLACLVAVLAPRMLVRCFVDSESVGLIAAATRDMRLSNCMIWCISLNIVATTYFQSIGKPKTAILLSLLRQVVCLIPCIWLLPLVFEDSAFAVWIAMPVSDVLACVATLPPFLSHMRFLRAAGLIRARFARPRPGGPGGHACA